MIFNIVFVIWFISGIFIHFFGFESIVFKICLLTNVFCMGAMFMAIITKFV